QDSALLRNHVAGLKVTVASERPDGEVVAAVADVGEVVHSTDVDEDRRRGQPQLHQRQKRHAAGKQLGVVAVLTQRRDRLLDGARTHVLECWRNHRARPPLLACWIASQTRCGDAGMSRSVIPSGASASTTAFMTAGVDAIVPASPTPFTPMGFVGLGVTVDAVSMPGISAADGTK